MEPVPTYSVRPPNNLFVVRGMKDVEKKRPVVSMEI